LRGLDQAQRLPLRALIVPQVACILPRA
jgi:hypothetical protein